jgi:hypothetical protein
MAGVHVEKPEHGIKCARLGIEQLWPLKKRAENRASKALPSEQCKVTIR